MSRKMLLSLMVAVVFLAPGATSAQTTFLRHPLGIRAGVTSWDRISQFHFGVHSDWGELAPNLALVPGVEMGVGDDFTIVTFNGDLLYRSTELVSRPWEMYGGGSLSFNIVDGPGSGSTTDLGVSGIVGLDRYLSNGHTMLMEVRLGIIDSPDLKVTLGYSLF